MEAENVILESGTYRNQFIKLLLAANILPKNKITHYIVIVIAT